MKFKFIVDEDFLQYKKASMFIGFPYCSFKCGAELCHNSALALAPIVDFNEQQLIERYINNPITEAFVFGGLDPFDSIDECYELIKLIRNYINDDIVIYTGYTEDECKKFSLFNDIISYNNIIIKYGRFIPNEQSHYDAVLGIKLASSNQYGVKYNEIKNY